MYMLTKSSSFSKNIIFATLLTFMCSSFSYGMQDRLQGLRQQLTNPTTQRNLLATVVLTSVLLKITSNLPSLLNTQVGCISINGEITDATPYLKQLEAFENNKNIKGLLLKINSPGGAPGTSKALYREIKKFKRTKPVVVVIETMCCSGAYLIASAADIIIAPAMAAIGSIGVVSSSYIFKNTPYLYSLHSGVVSADIEDQTLQAGKFKTTGSPFHKMTGEEVHYMQAYIDGIYHTFCTIIAQERNISIEEKNQWANGKIFSASEANNLIDKIGSISDGKDEIARLIKVRGGTVKGNIILVEKEKSVFETLFTGSLAQSCANFIHKTLGHLHNKNIPEVAL